MDLVSHLSDADKRKVFVTPLHGKMKRNKSYKTKLEQSNCNRR